MHEATIGQFLVIAIPFIAVVIGGITGKIFEWIEALFMLVISIIMLPFALPIMLLSYIFDVDTTKKETEFDVYMKDKYGDTEPVDEEDRHLREMGYSQWKEEQRRNR